MSAPNRLALFRACHLFERVVAHRLQETETVPSRAIRLAEDQTLVDQRGQALQHVDRLVWCI